MKTPFNIRKKLPFFYLLSGLFLASPALADNSISMTLANNSGSQITVKNNCDEGGTGTGTSTGTGAGSGTATGTGSGTATSTSGSGSGTSTGTGTGTISTNAAGCLSGTSTNGHNLCEGVNISGMEWGGNTDPNDNIVKSPSSAGASPPSVGGATLSSQTVESLTSFFASKGMNIIRLPFLWEYVQPWVNFGDMSFY